MKSFLQCIYGFTDASWKASTNISIEERLQPILANVLQLWSANPLSNTIFWATHRVVVYSYRKLAVATIVSYDKCESNNFNANTSSKIEP